MIRIVADGMTVYDSRLEGFELTTLTTTRGIATAGSMDIGMPLGHPSYNRYTPWKTIVELYDGDNEEPDFRGRAIYSMEDMNATRTIICAGERSFLADAVMRPYLYTDSPQNIFTDIIRIYNERAPADRQFIVGDITVTDANNYIRFESSNAEQVSETVDKLIERCGGYITFSTANGARRIHWLKEIGRHTNQKIIFGENLLDYSSSGAPTEPATAILPYGAVDQSTGLRLTIAEVNNGVDYLEDSESSAMRGFICKTVYWDDVTDALNLKRKAEAWLAENRNIVTALDLSAADLRERGINIKSTRPGDILQVLSPPHELDDEFLLAEKTDDWLNAGVGTITLGKEIKTLTAGGVAGDLQSKNELHRVTHEIKAEYQINAAVAVAAAEERLLSEITQSSDRIKTEIAAEYVKNGELESRVASTVTQTTAGLMIDYEEFKVRTQESEAATAETLATIRRRIDFSGGNIHMTAENAPTSLFQSHEGIDILHNGETRSRWRADGFHAGNLIIDLDNIAAFGNFAFMNEANGSLSFRKWKG